MRSFELVMWPTANLLEQQVTVQEGISCLDDAQLSEFVGSRWSQGVRLGAPLVSNNVGEACRYLAHDSPSTVVHGHGGLVRFAPDRSVAPSRISTATGV